MPYPPISEWPPVPSRNAPSTFSDRMDAFLAAFPQGRTEMNALAAYLDGLAILSTGGTFQVQSSADDATANRLLKVGAFGLGANQPTSVTDLDAVTYGGVTRITVSHASTPDGAGGWICHTFPFSPTGGAQIAIKATTGEMHRRNRASSVWGAWQRIFTQGSILGTVSQSGGVPTGAVIEAGSNANGSFTRFADGTQICRLAETLSVTTTASGGVFSDTGLTPWTFPAAFVSSPSGISFSARGAATWGTIGGALSATQMPRIVLSGSALTGASVNTWSTAIGRWF